MSDYTERPKHPLYSLFVYLGLRPTPFEFTVDEPIEVCVVRLQGQDTREEEQRKKALGILTMDARSIEISIHTKDRSTYSFSISRHGGRSVALKATGQMGKLSAYSTLVKGSIQAHDLSKLVFWFALAVLIFGICSLKAVFVGFVIYSVILMLVLTASNRKSFTGLIRETVNSPSVTTEK